MTKQSHKPTEEEIIDKIIEIINEEQFTVISQGELEPHVMLIGENSDKVHELGEWLSEFVAMHSSAKSEVSELNLARDVKKSFVSLFGDKDWFKGVGLSKDENEKYILVVYYRSCISEVMKFTLRGYEEYGFKNVPIQLVEMTDSDLSQAAGFSPKRLDKFLK